jgi:hypothetical protein
VAKLTSMNTVQRSVLVFALLSLVAGCGSDDPTGSDECGTCRFDEGVGECLAGRCVLAACNSGFFDMNNDLKDGCEYPCDPDVAGVELCDRQDNDCDGRIDEGFRLMTDLHNCGACGVTCQGEHAVPVCIDGSCELQECEEGWLDCSVEVAGCETERFSLDHCLSCGHACAFTAAEALCDEEGCRMGDCHPGFYDINADPEDGCEYACDPDEEPTERCDLRDNNCDGQVDEDFDVQTDLEHCGACGQLCAPENAAAICSEGLCSMVACNPGFGDCNPQQFGCETALVSVLNCGACGQVCSAQNGTPGCSDALCVIDRCEPGWYDINGDTADGCEYRCTDFAEGPDLPDSGYVDSNCDGIDGEVARAVFVAETGVDNPECTQVSPCGTVAHAVALAEALGRRDVYLQAGTYQGRTSLRSGIGVYGGYDRAWSRASHREDGHETTVVGATDERGEPVVFEARFVSTTLANLELRAPDAFGSFEGRGRSSYVVRAVGASLVLTDVLLRAGAGADGSPGAAGQDSGQLHGAANGSTGGAGRRYETYCNDSARGGGGNAAGGNCGGVGNGGSGGAGGLMDRSCSGWPDLDATGGRSGSGASNRRAGAGAGGGGGGTCRGGRNGSPGHVINGAGGAGGGVGGTLRDDMWRGVNGAPGAPGEHGTGGGGGGGSGGCDSGMDSYGAGGGGGGAGGCRARSGGAGGSGGGASIGILAIETSIECYRCTTVRAAGGRGGSGGLAGAGQAAGGGGAGGNGPGTGNGGRGGNGGHGGHAGGGGGGAGGPSIGLLYIGGQRHFEGSTTSAGQPGAGGAGGARPAGAPDAQVGGPGAEGASDDLLGCAAREAC